MTTVEIRLDKIQIDRGTQFREKHDMQVIGQYSEVYAESPEKMPPLSVVKDGKEYYLWDGFHRFKAARNEGIEKLPCNVTVGTLRDAVVLAAGANAHHGLQRTYEDRKRAIMGLLADPEWALRSDGWIAEACMVNKHLVGTVRVEVGALPEVVTGKDGRKIKVKRDKGVSDVQDSDGDGGSELQGALANALDGGDQKQGEGIELFTRDSQGRAGADGQSPNAGKPAEPMAGNELPEAPDGHGSVVEFSDTDTDDFPGFAKSRRLYDDVQKQLGEGLAAFQKLTMSIGFRTYMKDIAPELLRNLKTVIKTLKELEPDSACKACDGDGCERCGMSGWITKQVAKRME